ncbi:hypothetical protein BC830DRAFT_1130737 [Chytriomyces sp. MP71]|nr:hypothetical protein BC830DRAFT_1130737 [Chytriomyces sp. MP71]
MQAFSLSLFLLLSLAFMASAKTSDDTSKTSTHKWHASTAVANLATGTSLDTPATATGTTVVASTETGTLPATTQSPGTARAASGTLETRRLNLSDTMCIFLGALLLL